VHEYRSDRVAARLEHFWQGAAALQD
jgi:hypothetical protein